MARTRERTDPATHEQQPADEVIAAGDHMDLDEMQAQLDAERATGAQNPTGVVMPTPVMNPNLAEEDQGMQLTPKVFGPPQYGSPNPATSASKLVTLQDGHPLSGLPADHPAAISEDYAAEVVDVEVDATDAAFELAAENNVNLGEIEGTGRGGQITKGDVQKAIDERGSEVS